MAKVFSRRRIASSSVAWASVVAPPPAASRGPGDEQDHHEGATDPGDTGDDMGKPERDDIERHEIGHRSCLQG